MATLLVACYKVAMDVAMHFDILYSQIAVNWRNVNVRTAFLIVYKLAPYIIHCDCVLKYYTSRDHTQHPLVLQHFYCSATDIYSTISGRAFQNHRKIIGSNHTSKLFKKKQKGVGDSRGL